MKRKTVISYLKIFILLLACLWGLAGLRYSTSVKGINANIDKEVSAYLDLLEGDMETDFLHHEQDLVFMGQLTEILLEGAKSMEEVAETYAEFSKVTRSYDQVRLLDAYGMEVVRVDFKDNEPVVVAKENLQDKSDRYYFTALSHLDHQEIYYSPIDLNIEQGKIELPYNLMFRAGLRVESQDEGLLGYLILNVGVLDWMESESRSIAPYMDKVVDLSQLSFVNMEGYYLHHLNQDKEWGFILDGREEENLAFDLPDLWASRMEMGLSKGIQEGNTFYLKKIASFGSPEPVSGAPVDLGYFLYELPADRHFALLSEARRELWVLVLAALLAAGFGAYGMLVYRESRRKLIKDLHHRASRDLLTGLLNKQGFLEAVPGEMNRWDDGISAVGYFDIDDFKSVNDKYGHGVGDEVLIEVGRRLEDVLRERDLFARIHGDEFNILLKLRQEIDAQVIARRLINRMKDPVKTSVGDIHVTVSMGIAFFREGESFEAVAERADRLMYQVKQSGKSDYRIEGLASET